MAHLHPECDLTMKFFKLAMNNILWTRNFAVIAVSSPCTFWCLRDHSSSLKFGGISVKLGILIKIIFYEVQMHCLLFITNSLLIVPLTLEWRWTLKWFVSGSNLNMCSPIEFNRVEQKCKDCSDWLSRRVGDTWGKTSPLNGPSRSSGPLWGLVLLPVQGNSACTISCRPLHPQPICLTGFPDKM